MKNNYKMKLKNLGKVAAIAAAVFTANNVNAQIALDQTVNNGANEQIYKTIAFANGSLSYQPHPSYSIVGTKNIDTPTSGAFGDGPAFWRNTGGNGTFVVTNQTGPVTSTTIASENVGGKTLNWNSSHSRQFNSISNSNSLGINYTGIVKRGRADVNGDGGLDAQLSTFTLPAGTAAQTAGFLIGDVAIFGTPELKVTTGGTILATSDSFKKLNTNQQWEDVLQGPTGWPNRDIIDWISAPLATQEIKAIKTTIYPNPTTDKIAVQLMNTNKIDEYRLMNTAGQQILSGKNLSADETIDLKKLPAGLYILQVSVDGKVDTHKVIKK